MSAVLRLAHASSVVQHKLHTSFGTCDFAKSPNRLFVSFWKGLFLSMLFWEAIGEFLVPKSQQIALTDRRCTWHEEECRCASLLIPKFYSNCSLRSHPKIHEGLAPLQQWLQRANLE